MKTKTFAMSFVAVVLCVMVGIVFRFLPPDITVPVLWGPIYEGRLENISLPEGSVISDSDFIVGQYPGSASYYFFEATIFIESDLDPLSFMDFVKEEDWYRYGEFKGLSYFSIYQVLDSNAIKCLGEVFDVYCSQGIYNGSFHTIAKGEVLLRSDLSTSSDSEIESENMWFSLIEAHEPKQKTYYYLINGFFDIPGHLPPPGG